MVVGGAGDGPSERTRHGSGQDEAAAQRVLISGASFAGVTTAIWMQRLGYQVTIVELAAGPRKGGTPVDLHEDSMAIAERMGVLEAVMAKVLPPRATEFADIDGTPIPRGGGDDAKAYGGVVEDYEIHRRGPARHPASPSSTTRPR